MTAYLDRTKDFTQRTVDNLAIIDELARNRQQKPPAWEATQLINSALGLLVVAR